MRRTELVEKLELVAPALATNSLIPIMTHFWFRGDHVMAFNDTIAISVPCETDFECAVPGSTLLNLLKASRATDVELIYEKGELTVKAGATKMRLATMDKKNFNFDMPKPSKPLMPKVKIDDFTRAIEACLRSVSIDTSVPDYLGVTLIADRKELLFFSTNNSTMSHAHMSLPAEVPLKRAIIASSFCREMISLVDKKVGMTFEVQKDYSLFRGKNNTVLFGKLIESEKPIPYVKLFDQYFPAEAEKRLVAIPTKMELMLDRATIVAATSVTPVMTDIEVVNRKARFTTAAQKTEIFDVVELEKGQEDVKLRVDPKLVKAGYGSFTKMLLTERAFIMATETEFFLVANSEK
jgi:DNA polymerase III sliding clamp (beta) subunit (PCNA family)